MDAGWSVGNRDGDSSQKSVSHFRDLYSGKTGFLTSSQKIWDTFMISRLAGLEIYSYALREILSARVKRIRGPWKKTKIHYRAQAWASLRQNHVLLLLQLSYIGSRVLSCYHQ